MKYLRQQFGRLAALMALGASFGLTPLAQGGIIDILRGEPVVEWQRVAFIGSAEVKQVNGAAERLTGIDEWEALEAGTQLTPGDVIRSHPTGTVVLRMEESGSLVKVTPATVLRLAQLNPEWDEAALTGVENQSGFCVRGLRGKAWVQEAEKGWQPVEVNAVLPLQSVVRTEKNAALDLFDTREKRFVRILGGAETELGGFITLAREYSVPAVAASSPVLGR